MEVRNDFNKVLEVAGFNERKDRMKKHKITLHPFRRFTKSVVSDQAGLEFWGEGRPVHSRFQQG
ncbi:MAG: hypothetical protein WBE34_17865 [Candidatus Nitrosopolaris sp.]